MPETAQVTMGQAWRERLNHDPVAPLLSGESEALAYFVRRDLLQDDVGPVSQLWDLSEVAAITKKQQADGAWEKPGKRTPGAINHRLIETWRRFRFLVEMCGFTRESPDAAIERYPGKG